MNKIDLLDYRIQQAIPLVYSDDMSFVELIYKVYNKLNDVINSVNGYFATDLQTYVSTVITGWKNDGTLATIISNSVIGRVSLEMFPRLSGEVEDSLRIQRAIDYCVSNNYTELSIPNKVLYVTNSIDAKGIKIIGMGKPFIPFMTWDYTRPTSLQNDFVKYQTMCKGSVITTDKDISIFTTGLIAENIGLLGNRRSLTGSGISQTDGNQPIQLRKCVIAGFKEYGVYAPYGLIFFECIDTVITQNGKNGVYVDRNNGTYTGETNFFTVKNSQITRNESHGILAKVKGRGFYIHNNDFENNGEPSDTSRPVGTDVDTIVFGAYFEMHNSGGMTNGSFEFKGNYSEETFGLLYLNAVDPMNGVSIQDNQWYPYNQTTYSCGINLGGWLNKLSILNNNTYSAFDNIRFAVNNTIANLEIDDSYTGTVKWGVKPTIERKRVNDTSFVNINSNDVDALHAFTSGLCTGSTYSSNDGVTYYYVDPVRVNGTLWDGFDMGSDVEQRYKGCALIVGGVMVGLINGQSSTAKALNVRGNRVVAIGDGSVKIVRLGGFNTMNAKGDTVKLVVDWDNTIQTFGK
jgi:hypothetical protein